MTKTSDTSASDSFLNHFDAIKKWLDFIYKLTPLFPLWAIFVLWVYLREIGWVQLLQPSIASVNGLALLAMVALLWVGASLLVLVMPSLWAWMGDIVYAPDKPVPHRVKYILLGLSLLWLVALCLIQMSIIASNDLLPIFCILYGVGVLAYAAPGLCQAYSLKSKGCLEIWRRLWTCWTQSLAVEVKSQVASESNDATRNSFAKSCFKVCAPLWVVLTIILSAMLIVYPIVYLLGRVGESWEADLGTWPTLILISLCGVVSVVPACMYWNSRGLGRSYSSAWKATAMSGCIILLVAALLIIPRISWRDEIFTQLHIRSSTEENFLVMSDQATKGLKQLQFDMRKLEGLTIVRAWVRYEFGDTVLLCKQIWKKTDLSAKGSSSVEDRQTIEVEAKGDVCFPLQRSELRPWRGAFPEP